MQSQMSKCEIILSQGLPMKHQQATEGRLVLMQAYEGMLKRYLRVYPNYERARALGVWNDTMKGVTGETYGFRMTDANLTRAIAFADIWVKEIKGGSND